MIIIFCLFIIFVSGYYSYWYSSVHFVSLKDYLKNEEDWHGRDIALNYQRITSLGPGYFEICGEGRTIRVAGEVKNIKPGDIISFKGVFQKSASVKLTDYYISRHRRIKYGVSALAAFLSFIWLFANFRIDWKKFVLIERR